MGEQGTEFTDTQKAFAWFFRMLGMTSFRVGFFSIISSSDAYSKQALMYLRICPDS